MRHNQRKIHAILLRINPALEEVKTLQIKREREKKILGKKSCTKAFPRIIVFA